MSYDLTIRPTKGSARQKPLKLLAAFLERQPHVRRNGTTGFVLDDGVRWMELDAECNSGRAGKFNCIRAHIPLAFLGDDPETNYFVLLRSIAAELKWKLVDEQADEDDDPDFEEADDRESTVALFGPVFAEPEISSLIGWLREGGYSITKLGHNDPPRRWKGTDEEAIREILSGDGSMTIYPGLVAVRKDGLKLHLNITIDSDPTYGYSTVSTSMLSQHDLRSIAKELMGILPCYLAFLARVDPKPDSAYNVHRERIHQTDACPDFLLQRFGWKRET